MKSRLFLKTLSTFALLVASISLAFAQNDEADLPPFARGMDKGEYLRLRSEEIALKRGYEDGKGIDVNKRIDAIHALERDEERQLRAAGLNAYRWNPIGPEPIPNGQTDTTVTPVSGRTIAIAVHPTNPDKVYVGTANGGLYRSLDGGVSWKALTDSLLSLAIGAITIDPVDPTKVWIGTGEGNGSADSFFGVGIYRILNAESANPTIEGPFGSAPGSHVAGCGTAATANAAFLNRSITRIAFDPNNANRAFIGVAGGTAGFGIPVLPANTGAVGLWLVDNINAASPVFALCRAGSVKDIVFEPGSSNNLLFHTTSTGTAGVYRSTTAASATISPSVALTSTQTLAVTTGNTNGELAINKVGAVVTVLSANGAATNGQVFKSTNGGATWGAAIATASGFCGGQCFYDIGVALDPLNANRMYVAGNVNPNLFKRSTNGTTFVSSSTGLHSDSHAIAIAPSNTAIIYTGNDGGIYKSTDFGVTWTSLNVSGFNATQFQSLDTHPSNSEFMIGGTQDNGTQLRSGAGNWTRADFGDGGFALIDQNAADTTNVRMYHTYFNQTTAMGYARVTTTASASDNNWTFFGCGFTGSTANGMTCTATAIRFYAPMARGPGNPNTLYFGSDVLYRSTNGGTTVSKVSQDPIVSGVAISAIGVAANSDNVRAVGLNNGNVWRTTTGANPLNNVSTGLQTSGVVSDVVIDQNNNNIAYVAYSNYYAAAGQNIFKTSNFSAATPTWTASSVGIPNVPVNTLVIDPRNSSILYAGTDIGVYRSTDSGANWSSFSNGLPRSPVFDMAFQAGAQTTGAQTLRIATHGRGIWEIAIRSAPSAITEIATSVTRFAATLNGTVNDNLFNTTVSFEYGLTTAYGSTIAATPGSVSSNTDTAVSANISGLTPYTLYHYRVVATNAVGTTFGQDQTFVTGSQGLQVGSIVLGASKQADFNRVTRVKFAQQFATTPIVITQVSNEDADPTALRVVNVSTTGFDLLQVEAPGCTNCNGANGTATVHWLAASAGCYRIPNQASPGSSIEIRAGTVTTTSNQRNTASGFAGWPAAAWQAVTFPVTGDANCPALRFGSAPVVLSGLQSWTTANEGSNLTVSGANSTLVGPSQPWMTSVVRNITSTGFDVALESSEVDDDDAAPTGITNNETIGYIAIQAGTSAQFSALGGAGNVGVAAGVGTATDTCSTIDLNFPAGTTISAPSLRGFSSKQSRNDADGGWTRRCTLTAPGGLTARMGVRIDEDADIDAERVHATAEATGNLIFSGDFATTPITLAYLKSQVFAGAVNVEFASANEVGNLGYRLWGRSSKSDDWRPLSGLIPTASKDTMRSNRYQTQIDGDGISEIRLEDIDILGQSRFHPGIAVGQETGALPVEPSLDWQRINNENANTFREAQAATDAGMLIATTRGKGIYRVSLQELAKLDLIDTGSKIENLAITRRGMPVARFLNCLQIDPNCYLEWLAEERESLYGKAEQYQISLNAALVHRVGVESLDGTASPEVALISELEFAPDRGYSFSAPGADPWFDERLLSTGNPVALERTFSLPNRSEGDVQMTLRLWGGLDYQGQAPDHDVEIYLNNVLLDRRQFDGLSELKLDLSLPQSLLQSINRLGIRLTGQTGYNADVVLLDGFTVRYPRVISGSTDLAEFGRFPANGPASDNLFSENFEPRSKMSINAINTSTVIWSYRHGKTYRSLVSQNTAVDRATSALWIAAESSVQTASLRKKLAAPQAAPVDYLIITHPLFASELAPIVNLQQARGYTVGTVLTDQIYDALNYAQPDPEAIAALIDRINPRFVLLVGGDSYDYNDNLALGSRSFLPTFYRKADAIVRFAASDMPFVDRNGDGIPERAIGRIPARTQAELNLAVQSILARAAAPAERYFATAGQSGENEHFADDARAMQSYLRQNQAQELATVDQLGLAEARSRSVAALSGAADWVSYLGHSSPNRWAFQNLLDTNQLASISRTGAPAIVSQWGCWNNYFVMPDQDTMSHALMLRSNQLAAAVIGSTALAENSSHLALATRLFDLLEDGRFADESERVGSTLGEVIAAAKARLAITAPEHIESNFSITLFGDPAQPVASAR